MDLKSIRGSIDVFIPNIINSHNHEIHFNNVIELYNNAFNYISHLPSFHVGYDKATNLLLDLVGRSRLKGQTVLELGCGMGNSTVLLAKEYASHVTAIDINKKQISECMTRIHESRLTTKTTIMQKNILDLDSDIGSFDIIWSEDAFSHVPNKEKVFSICYKLLKSEGLLVFSDLIKSHILNNEKKLFCEAWCLWDLFAVNYYIKKIAQSGFTILEMKTGYGRELADYHVQVDKLLGDIEPDEHIQSLMDNKQVLVKKWGNKGYDIRLQKLNTINYLIEGKLDYIFIVAQKQ